jgi:hypothetical protein
MRYYFSHDHAFRLFFAHVPHLVPRRPRSVDDIERKKFGKLRYVTSHDEDKNLYGFLCMEVWTPNVPAFSQDFWFELKR